MPPPAPMEQASPLLHLPQELQEKIYEEAMSGQVTIVDTNYRIPGLLLVCKQTYTRCCAMLYPANIFEVSDRRTYQEWLDTIGVNKYSKIPEIRLRWVGTSENQLTRLDTAITQDNGKEFTEPLELYCAREQLQLSYGHVFGEGVLKARVVAEDGKEIWRAREVVDIKMQPQADDEPGVLRISIAGDALSGLLLG